MVAGGLIEGPEGLLLVRNRRRDGSLDWSPPGGVVDVAAGEAITSGLSREVEEETGLVVEDWAGPVYQVETEAVTLGWRLRVEVHRARSYSGEVRIADPDGIVVDARFVPAEECSEHVSLGHRWVWEPLAAWLDERWEGERSYRYRVDGPGPLTVVRL